MISNAAPQCTRCAHLIRMPAEEVGFDRRCRAFPEGIPEELYTSSADHTKPYPGDGGFRFEEYTGNLDLEGNLTVPKSV